MNALQRMRAARQCGAFVLPLESRRLLSVVAISENKDNTGTGDAGVGNASSIFAGGIL